MLVSSEIFVLSFMGYVGYLKLWRTTNNPEPSSPLISILLHFTNMLTKSYVSYHWTALPKISRGHTTRMFDESIFHRSVTYECVPGIFIGLYIFKKEKRHYFYKYQLCF